MAQTCTNCGAAVADGALHCTTCGAPLTQQAYQQPYAQYQQPYGMPHYQPDPSWPVKNKIVAGILGILLGGLGIHKFYMGKIGMGILYILFCWTWIPEIVGLIEGILYLVSSDEAFSQKHQVRLG